MPTQYLDGFNSLVKAHQRKALEKSLAEKVRTGAIKSSQEFNEEVEKLVARIDPTNRALLTLRLVETSPEAPVKVSSRDYNETMQEVAVDLETLYRESNLSSEIISRQEILSVDFVKQFRAELNKLRAIVESSKALAEDTEGSIGIYHEDFTDITGDRKSTRLNSSH